jgi:hypothetical protein
MSWAKTRSEMIAQAREFGAQELTYRQSGRTTAIALSVLSYLLSNPESDVRIGRYGAPVPGNGRFRIFYDHHTSEVAQLNLFRTVVDMIEKLGLESIHVDTRTFGFRFSLKPRNEQ